MKYAPVFYKNIFFALTLLVILPAVLFGQKKDNQGKEFYVAFAENQGAQGFGGGGQDLNFFALFITSKVPTRGLVEVTALGFSQAFTTTPGTITTIELPDGKSPGDPTVELTFGNNQEERIVSGMAVHITSDDEITVYGINEKQYSTDAFMALPVDVLGTEYRTLNYPTSFPSGGGFNGVTPGEFWVVGVADSTNITMTPKATTRNGIAGGTKIKQLIYKGDVYLIQGDPNDTKNDLTGSLIEADQPVAVFSGHVRTEIPQGYKNKDGGGQQTSRDHLVEQLPPVSAWGDSALVVRYASASLPDLVRIVSSEDDNVITINSGSGVKSVTLKAGDFYEITQLTGPTSIQATSPILVGQYMHTSVYGTSGQQPAYGDPAYALVFPVEQFDSSYTFMLVEDQQSFTGNYINIVADPAGKASMMLDGKSITAPPYNAAFLPIPGSNYQFTQIKLPQGAHHIYSDKTFGITVYALGNVNSYSYPGGTGLKTITPFKTVDLVIDFGDRVMTGPPPYDPLKNHWDTTVYLQNISSDPYTINGFTTRTGDFGNFSVVAPAGANLPRTIGAGVKDSITIEFTPDRPDVRMHTKLNAVTEHLKAYVVDVYGRGILQNAQVFSDSTAKSHIDTLDFGVFDAAVDPPKDSFVFVFNKGEKDLIISGANIVGTNAASFSLISTTIKSNPVATPYTLHPYNLLSLQDSGAKMTLEFKPGGLANGYYEAELDINTSGLQRKVFLIAHIKTILKSNVLGAAFDTAFLCQEQARSISVDNPNDFPITVTDVTLGGANPTDFNLATSIPLVVDPMSKGEIKLNYAPQTIGISNATAIVSFDLPKGFADTLKFTAFADQFASKFWARDNIHILPGEETLFPIYAKLPMERFGSPGFVLRISYDPSHLEDFDYVQDNTLTSTGAYTVNYDTAGYREYYYHTLDNSFVSGGSDTEKMALVYIRFRSHHLEGEDPATFHLPIDINYKITFDQSPVPDGCIASVAPAGRITLDSTCEQISLLHDTMLFPAESYIEPVRPNPVYEGRAKFIFDVPKEDMVALGLYDAMGNKAAEILAERRKPGTYKIEYNTNALQAGMYYIRLQTAGQTKLRKLVIVK